MAFPKNLLHEHEDLVLDLRPHWWFMAEPTAALLGSVIVGVFLLAVVDWWDFLNWIAVLLIVGCLVWFGVRYLKWTSTNFVVTTDRVVFRVGVIAKKGIEIPLERVNTVFFHQGIFERMIGAGDIAIESGGETGKESFSDIRKPSAVQNEIYKQMELNNNRMYSGGGSAPAPPTSGSIPEQIDQLDDLRKRGVISEAEFQAKKDELLKRM
jgi:membrane protein YdbS with pleckstrin-like domain